MSRRLHRQRGIAAIETALLMMVSIGALAMIVLAGRLTWHAIALTKGIANTNRIVATLPIATIISGPDALKGFTKETLYDATQSAGLDMQPRADTVTVMCGIYACAESGFTSISITAGIAFRDTIFDSDFHHVIPENFLIRSAATQTYATTFPPVAKN